MDLGHSLGYTGRQTAIPKVLLRTWEQYRRENFWGTIATEARLDIIKTEEEGKVLGFFLVLIAI